MLIRLYQFYKCIPLCPTLNYIQLMCLIIQLITKNIYFFYFKIKIIYTRIKIYK